MDTNRIDTKLGEIVQWQKDHQEEDDNTHKQLNGRFDSMESSISLLPTKDEVAEVVRQTLLDTLFKTGKWTKLGIITAATIIGSLVVIGGGLKWILGLIGFSYMK